MEFKKLDIFENPVKNQRIRQNEKKKIFYFIKDL